MNWGFILFSMKGRLGPNAFLIGALVLIGISTVLTLAPLLNASLASLGILGLPMVWCWIALWVKRLHDAGQSGWMFIVVLIIYFIVSMILTPIITAVMGAPVPEFSGDFSDFMEFAQESAVLGAVPNAVAGFVVSLLVVWVANLVLKSTPGDNEHGPQPTTASSAPNSDSGES